MHCILVRGVLFTKDVEILTAKIAYICLLVFGVVVITVLPLLNYNNSLSEPKIR